MKTTQVTFELIDFELSATTGDGGSNYYSQLLMNKFASQQFNLCKWFRKRDEFLANKVKLWDFASMRETNYIPLEFMECRQVVQQAVSKNCQLFIDYSGGSFPEWKFDKELLKSACKSSGGMLHYGDPSIAFDDDVIEEVCQCKGFSLNLSSSPALSKFESNKAFLMKVLEKNPFNLFLINNDLSNDEDIISMAAKYNVLLDGENTVSRQLAKIYIRSNADNLQQLTKFHNNVEIIEMAVTRDGLTLKYSSIIDTPYNVVKIAVKQNGLALEFASESFRDSYDVVQVAVKQNGLSLKFASERLRSDNSIAKIAISNNPLAIEHVINVCLEIKLLQESVMDSMSQDSILKSIEKNDCYLKHVPWKWWNDIHFVEKALLVNEKVYHFLPHHFRTNKELLLRVLSKNVLIEIDPFLLESDEEFLFKCFATSSQLCAKYKFTHNQLSDREFIKKALRFNSRILTSNNEVFTLYRYDREMVMHGLKQDPCIGRSFPDLLSDREVVLELAKFNGFFCELFQQSPIPFEILSLERFNAEYENVYLTRNNCDFPKQRLQ